MGAIRPIEMEKRPLKVTRLSFYSHLIVILGRYTGRINTLVEVVEMEILKIQNLSKIYGKGETAVKALDNVSFSVKKGEFVAIIGPSGSGKSTLLHLLGGVDRPTSGKVFVENTDMYTLNETQLAIFRRRQIGLIYQFYNLIPILTVAENITLPLLLDQHKVDQQQFDQLVKLLNLEQRLSHLPNQLSGGQQQRVSIGRALISNPAIMLADEPTGNLDSKNSKEIVDLLKMFNKSFKQTLVVITHDERIALQADRIISIEDGRIAKDEVIRP
jgi:putative ABC transport system ATP-binding protein